MRRLKQNEINDPLPPGWLEDLLAKADLERSFAELRGIKHFWADAWRGRIRSLQLRHDVAWKYFENALQHAAEAEDHLATRIQQVIVEYWCFENALGEGTWQGPEDSDKPPNYSEEEPAEPISMEPQELRPAFRHRDYAEGLQRLHQGDHSRALVCFNRVVEEDADPWIQALACLGQLAALHNLRSEAARDRSLETTAQRVRTAALPLLEAHAGGILSGFMRYLRRDEEGESWKAFVEALPCPQATKEVFLRRGVSGAEKAPIDGGYRLSPPSKGAGVGAGGG